MKTFFCICTLLTCAAATAYGNCYVLENRTSTPVKLQFNYNGPVGTGTVKAVELAPNGRYPSRGEWCWDTPADRWASVDVSSSAEFKTSWNGRLVLGNGGPAYASGRYTVQPPSTDDSQGAPRGDRRR
jgi:hypothetical protein